MTQTEQIKLHFKSGRSITQNEALSLYGIGRLASRMNDLKNEGYPFVVEMTNIKNRYDKNVVIATYKPTIEEFKETLF